MVFVKIRTTIDIFTMTLKIIVQKWIEQSKDFKLVFVTHTDYDWCNRGFNNFVYIWLFLVLLIFECLWIVQCNRKPLFAINAWVFGWSFFFFNRCSSFHSFRFCRFLISHLTWNNQWLKHNNKNMMYIYLFVSYNKLSRWIKNDGHA